MTNSPFRAALNLLPALLAWQLLGTAGCSDARPSVESPLSEIQLRESEDPSPAQCCEQLFCRGPALRACLQEAARGKGRCAPRHGGRGGASGSGGAAGATNTGGAVGRDAGVDRVLDAGAGGGKAGSAGTDAGNGAGGAAVDASVDRAGDAGATLDAGSPPPGTCASAPGALLDLGTFGSDTTAQAVDINDNGQVLCKSSSQTFVWDNGATQLIPFTFSVLAINNAGRIIGTSALASSQLGSNPPTLWDNAVPQALSFPAVVDTATLSGLSNSGMIIGAARVQRGCQDCFDAFRWIGIFQDLGTLGTPPPTGAVPPPSAHSSAAAINDLGQVVGTTTTPTSAGHAFLALPMIDLGTLGGQTSAAVGLNDSGQVTGTSDTATGTQEAFLWQAGTMQGLGSLNGGSSRAVAINASGQVLGNNDLGPGGAAGPRAFLWSAGTMIDLGTLGGPSSTAVAINDAGQVIGTSVTASGDTHAFLWQAGSMTDLGTLGGSFSRPTAINASGQVVGVSTNAIDNIRAFLACPAVPAAGTPKG